MNVSEAVGRLKRIGLVSLRADKLKAISEDLHHCVGMMAAYNQEDDLAEDVYKYSPDQMSIRFAFEADSFTACIDLPDYGYGPGREPYEYLAAQSSEDDLFAFLKLVEGERVAAR